MVNGTALSKLDYAAVGRIEYFASDMAAMAGRAGIPAHNFSLPRPTKDNAHTTKLLKCAQFDLESEPALVRRLCTLYRLDYVCLGYDVPRMCR